MILHPDESRLPWVGAGIGIILGVIIVISDSVLTKAPTLTVSHVQLFNLSVFNYYIFVLHPLHYHYSIRP